MQEAKKFLSQPPRGAEVPSAVPEWLAYRMDPDIEAQRDLFTEDEHTRLRGYRDRINAVSFEQADGGRKMTKPTGEVLGDDFDDYFALIYRLKDLSQESTNT